MIRILFLSGIMTTFSLCKGQAGHENPTIQAEKDAIGTIVSELVEEIWSVYQDRKNNYWFGSNGNGVFFYDGKKIVQFTKKDGLIGNQIRGIQEDNGGNIYFDTPEGISKFGGFAFTTLKPIYDPNNEWKSEANDLWFKGNGNINGVYRYDGKSLFHLKFPEYDLEKVLDSKQEYTAFSPYGVYDIYQDKKGNLWFGTLSAGVYLFSEESQLWISEKELAVLDDGRVPGVRSIIEDKEGKFWLSNILNSYKVYPEYSTSQEKNVFKYQKSDGIAASKDQESMKFPYFMSAVTDDKNNDLWMVTYAEGVWRYDGEQLSNYRIKDEEKEVRLFSIYKDNQGALWLGTHNAGALKFNGKSFERFEPNNKKAPVNNN